MKFAIFGDIHGNIDALKAAYEAARADITREIVNTEFLRVPYDVEKKAQAIMASGLPAYFAEKLKKAI
jgi:hypothetical protein